MPHESRDLHAFSDPLANYRLETADDQGGVEITARQMKAILASLPAEVSVERQKRLARELRVYAKWNFPRLRCLDEDRKVANAQRRQAKAVAADVRALIKSLHAANPDLRRDLGWASRGRWEPLELSCSSEIAWFMAGNKLNELSERLDRLARRAEEKAESPGPGRPSKLRPSQVIRDLAIMFERATGVIPTRCVARDPDDGQYDYGPFYEFAAAVWPALFGKGKLGLSGALRQWGSRPTDKR